MSNLPVDPKEIGAMFWEQMSPQDFAIPRVKLAQGTGANAKNAGKFVYNTGEAVDSIKGCKLIVPTKTRVLFAGEGKARCASDNYYSPSERIKNPVSVNCLTCPLGHWGKDPLKDEIAAEIKQSNYDGNKPLCNETYNLLVADSNWNLFFITFQKAQLKAVSENLFTRLRYNFGQHAPYHVQFDISSRHITGSGKSYYVVEFGEFSVVDDKDKKIAEDTYMNWSKKASDILAKQHEEMDMAKNDEPPF